MFGCGGRLAALDFNLGASVKERRGFEEMATVVEARSLA